MKIQKHHECNNEQESQRDYTLTPYELVSRIYSHRHPHDQISPERAQVVGLTALAKLRARIKRGRGGK